MFLTSAAKYEGGKCVSKGLINTKCTQCGPDETAGPDLAPLKSKLNIHLEY